MRPLLFCLLGIFACVMSSCNQASDRALLDWRKVVLDGATPSDRKDEIFAKQVELGPEDILWLQEKVTDVDWVVRIKAAWILGRSGSASAAWSIWVASEVEELDGPYACMVTSLGRMGNIGRPYLVRLLEDRGLTYPLLSALAQASGVRQEKNFFGFAVPAEEWWNKSGKAELGGRIPKDPVRPAPETEMK